MAYSGKEFENDFKDSWSESKTDSSLIRLYDTTNGFRGVANPCDFIMGTDYGTALIECKTTKETAFSFDNLSATQYEGMLKVGKDTTNTFGGVLIYFREYGTVVYYMIEEIEAMKELGQKSVNPIRHTEWGRPINIKKKRIHVAIDIEDLLNTFKEYYGGIRTWEG